MHKEVVITSVRQYPTSWIVGYSTRAYVEAGSVSHALAGRGPIIINIAPPESLASEHRPFPQSSRWIRDRLT